jgi:hypothetical protein
VRVRCSDELRGHPEGGAEPADPHDADSVGRGQPDAALPPHAGRGLRRQQLHQHSVHAERADAIHDALPDAPRPADAALRATDAVAASAADRRPPHERAVLAPGGSHAQPEDALLQEPNAVAARAEQPPSEPARALLRRQRPRARLRRW